MKKKNNSSLEKLCPYRSTKCCKRNRLRHNIKGLRRDLTVTKSIVTRSKVLMTWFDLQYNVFWTYIKGEMAQLMDDLFIGTSFNGKDKIENFGMKVFNIGSQIIIKNSCIVFILLLLWFILVWVTKFHLIKVC